MNFSLRRIFTFCIAFLFLAGFCTAATLYWCIESPGTHDTPVTVIIPPNSGTKFVAEELLYQGVIPIGMGYYLFPYATVLTGNRGQLKAGEYLIPAHASLHDIITMMAEGHVVIRKITVPEGFNTKEILALLQSAEGLTGDAPTDIKEGELLPETYHYSYGDSRAQIIQRMRAGMQKTLAELWAARDPSIPLTTPQQAVTLASLVEEETGKPDERPHISSVFYNRLRIGMKLQSDPTVLYGLGRGAKNDNRSITLNDLQSNTPYNTYIIPGLPPGPISNPGRAALAAVLHPTTTPDLYFVADGTGGHRFAATLAEHNKNVATWRALGKR